MECPLPVWYNALFQNQKDWQLYPMKTNKKIEWVTTKDSRYRNKGKNIEGITEKTQKLEEEVKKITLICANVYKK